MGECVQYRIVLTVFCIGDKLCTNFGITKKTPSYLKTPQHLTAFVTCYVFAIVSQ